MILLLFWLFLCHWLADYTWLSTTWMLMAKRLGTPLFPIFVHALVHTILMAITLLIYFRSSIPLFYSNIILVLAIQLFSHFLIDVWKGKMNVWFPVIQSPMNKIHWVVFGYDQLLHTTVILIMVHILLT